MLQFAGFYCTQRVQRPKDGGFRPEILDLGRLLGPSTIIFGSVDLQRLMRTSTFKARLTETPYDSLNWKIQDLSVGPSTTGEPNTLRTKLKGLWAMSYLVLELDQKKHIPKAPVLK